MTGPEVRRLEAAIGRPLSAPVRDFFLRFPPRLRELEAEADPDQDDFWLTDDIDALVAVNSAGRDGLRPLDWEPRVLFLGAGGCGETYWVDLDSPAGSVHRFEAGQEARWSDDIADSIAEFARGMMGEG